MTCGAHLCELLQHAERRKALEDMLNDIKKVEKIPWRLAFEAKADSTARHQINSSN